MIGPVSFPTTSKPVTMAETNELESTDIDQTSYEAEFGGFEIDLEEDEKVVEQLAPSDQQYIARDPSESHVNADGSNDETDSSDEDTDLEEADGRVALWGGTYTMRVGCELEKLRFGTWEGKPALLVVFDFAFQTINTSAVFRNAEINIRFIDSSILATEPKAFHGTMDRFHGEAKLNLKARVGAGDAIPADVGAGIEYEKPRMRITEGSQKIRTIPRDNMKRLSIYVEENTMVENSGMFRDFSVPVVVKYKTGESEPGFQVAVNVQANLGWRRFGRPVCGKKKKPFPFHTARLRRRAERQHPMDVNLKENVALRTLTRLESIAVGQFHD